MQGAQEVGHTGTKVGLHDTDEIVFITPIYYYEIYRQPKTLLDRAPA